MAESGARAVLLPDPSWPERSSTIAQITAHGIVCADIDGPLDSKAVCAQLLTEDLRPPLVVVAHGAACLVLPSVALALKTRHRNTLGYVLIDPDAPPATDTWPEAPVFVVSSTEATGTSLRGWPVVRSEGDTPVLVAQRVQQLLSA